MEGPAPWDAWRELAEAEWRHRLALPGAELLAEVQALEQGEGYTWALEQIYRDPGGLLVFARRARSSGDAQDALELVAAPDPEALVAALRARLGIPPGRVELLGEAGIEIGLEPGDVEED